MSRTLFEPRNLAFIAAGIGLAFGAGSLASVAYRTPTSESLWLVVAILAALPWSLALLLLDASGGFADRAAFTVAIGLLFNGLALWLGLFLLWRTGRSATGGRGRDRATRTLRDTSMALPQSMQQQQQQQQQH
ncbi:membrane hypothetical protein [Burkholderiales bacterium 8X]|nr:membrane hypothetical protein [Burkholderiales bacterium 8X]